jgi:CspA family cold shock protein
MQTGKIKWFDATKGWGFIYAADGAEIFVHGSGVRFGQGRKLQPGDRVEFEIEQGGRTQGGGRAAASENHRRPNDP